MAQVLDDCEFWLPPKFLCDDDDDHVFTNNNKGGTDIEEDYLVGLTRQISLNKNDNLFKALSACGCKGSNHDFATRYAAASREVARLQTINNSQLLSQQNMLALLQLEKQREIMKRENEMMMLMASMQKQKQLQVVQNRGFGFGYGYGFGFQGVRNGGSAKYLGLSQTAWPLTQQGQEQSNRRAVFVGNPTKKKECAGTGVFLPRRVNTPMGQTHFQPRLNRATVHPFYNNDGVARAQGNNAAARLVQMHSGSTRPVVSQEAGLPWDWTY